MYTDLCQLTTQMLCSDAAAHEVCPVRQIWQKKGNLLYSRVEVYKKWESTKAGAPNSANAKNASNTVYTRQVASSAEVTSVRACIGELGCVKLQKLLERQPLHFWSRSDEKFMFGEVGTHIFNLRHLLMISGRAQLRQMPVVHFVPPSANTTAEGVSAD